MGIGSDEVGLKLDLDKYHVWKCVTFVRTGCPLKKIQFQYRPIWWQNLSRPSWATFWQYFVIADKGETKVEHFHSVFIFYFFTDLCNNDLWSTGEGDSSEWEYQEQQQDVTSLMEREEESGMLWCETIALL